MTFKFMRPALAIALALTLGACGGKASFTVGGTVVGLQYKGLVLSSNGMDLSVAPGATATSTAFAFPNSISYGDVYDVSVKTQPEHQSCTVGAFTDPSTGKVTGVASDTAGRLASINVGVLCTIKTFDLGGKAYGLTSTGLVLTNGTQGGSVAVALGTPETDGGIKFTLPQVPYGSTYGVSVLTQPDKDICTVTQNSTGVMGDAAVDNVKVECSPKPTPAA